MKEFDVMFTLLGTVKISAPDRKGARDIVVYDMSDEELQSNLVKDGITVIEVTEITP